MSGATTHRRALLVASKTGYQVAEFFGAAQKLGIDLVMATDRCHILDDPYGDQATALRFDAPYEGIEALRARGPLHGIVAVGDLPAYVAAQCAQQLGLLFHPPEAVSAANDKYETRRRFAAAGLNVPEYRLLLPGDPASQRFPCVLKPLHSSGSRGVIRANNLAEFATARARILKMTGSQEALLVEDFIPGREFALEGLVTGGELRVLALFDKPDPLDGPFFEETIYVTPSRESAGVQRAIAEAAQRAVTALGLRSGSVHAEMRVNSDGVWMLEAAGRPIGGLCSRVLRFSDPAGNAYGLEELLLRHALAEDVSRVQLAPGAHGVMMIPIPRAGVYSGVRGLEQARQTADIDSIEITAKLGQVLEPLPEGRSYLGFIFARASTALQVEKALRQAHSALKFEVSAALPMAP